MNLTWHIAKKDIRRFWAPLALPSAVTLIRLGVGVRLLVTNGPDREWFTRMAIYSNILWGVGLFVTFMLVAAVIQEDSVASPAFWQTRPISGSRLLAAKALGLLLMFGLLPVLLSIPWWLGNGFGFSQICSAAAETFAVQSGVVLLALPFAVVSGQIGRFLLWTFVAAIGWITFTLVFIDRDISPWPGASAGQSVTRLLLIALLIAAGGLAVTVHQFVKRRTWLSIALIGVMGFLIVSVWRWSVWNPSAFLFPKPAAPTGPARDISISFSSARASWKPVDPVAFASVVLSVDHIPSNFALMRLSSEQDLKWSDGTGTHQARFEMGGQERPGSAFYAQDLLRITPGPRNQDWMQYAMRRYMTPLSILNRDVRWRGKNEATFYFELSPQGVRKLQREMPDYEGTFWFRLFQAELVGERAVALGSEFEKGSIHTRIAAVDDDEKRQILWLSLVERSPAHPLEDFLEVANLRAWRTEPVYCVVNRNRSRASYTNDESKDHAFIAGVAITMRKFGIPKPSSWNSTSRKWEREPDGFEGATLAEIEYREVERFSLPLKVEKIPLSVTIQGSARPSARMPVSVSGEANRPGSYLLFSNKENVVSALQVAGGVSDRADLSSVSLTRAGADGSETTTIVNVESWLEGDMPPGQTIPTLQAGDVISVPAKDADQPSSP